MTHGRCLKENTVKLGICGFCTWRNYCPTQEILQSITHVNIHLFINDIVYLLRIQLGTRGSKMNDKAPDLAGIPEDVRIMHTKLVSELEGLGKGKFKPHLWEPREGKMDSLYLVGGMRSSDSFFSSMSFFCCMI